jgi:oligopeptide/dipeptide ABC transporter ATP-binding protein
VATKSVTNLEDARDAPLLQITDLRVTFPTDDGDVKAVDGVNLTLQKGETIGIVGESGSGKSVTSMAMLGLHSRRARITGSIRFKGQEIVGRSEAQLQPIRGQGISMVFQDALAGLNPTFTVGSQIAEAITVHRRMERAELRHRVIELLDIVGIPSPSQRAEQYPHELSGGMRQRAMIAMSIANDPDVLIADEPTTALDVTIQAQVLEVLKRIQERTRSAIMIITHDLGVVAGMADRVLVMYAGRPVELGRVEDIFYRSRHPYTRGLLASLPRMDRREQGALYHIPGQPPSLIFLPPGCAFAPRCAFAQAGRCDAGRPDLGLVGDQQLSACLRWAELDATPAEAAR